MRWDRLFEDLEGQLEADQEHGQRAEIADRTRAEAADLTIPRRLRAQGDARVTMYLHGGHRLTGVVQDVTDAYVILRDDARTHLVATMAVAVITTARPGAGAQSTQVEARMGLGKPLREWARDRCVVQVVTSAGTFNGTVEQVGKDHFELGEHTDETRPRGRLPRLTIAFAAVLVVTRS